MHKKSQQKDNRLKKVLVINSVVSILFTFMLILPSTYGKYLDLLNNATLYFHLGGSLFVAPTDGVYILLVNTVGIDMALIAVFIIYASQDVFNRQPIIIFYMITRILLFLMNLYYYFGFNTPKAMMLFGIVDFIFILTEMYYFSKILNRGRISNGN